MSEQEEETKKIEKKQYEVITVATATGPAIQTPEGELISEAQLLVKIANDIDEVKKGLVG